MKKDNIKDNKQEIAIIAMANWWFDSILFDELYNNHIEGNLTLFEDTVKSHMLSHEDSEDSEGSQGVLYQIELEFNEERAIEIEIEADLDFVIDDKDVFQALLIDAFVGNCDLETYCARYGYDIDHQAYQEYVSYNLLTGKLQHLIGRDLFDKFMTCCQQC